MATATSLIEHLGRQMGTTLALEQGVCAIFDNQAEVVTIEIASGSGLAVLHRGINAQLSNPYAHERLLRLNFDIAQLSGSWVALDPQGNARICAQLPLALLDENYFGRWVEGFVNNCARVEAQLGQLA